MPGSRTTASAGCGPARHRHHRHVEPGRALTGRQVADVQLDTPGPREVAVGDVEDAHQLPASTDNREDARLSRSACRRRSDQSMAVAPPTGISAR